MGNIGIIIGCLAIALAFFAICFLWPERLTKDKVFPNEHYNAIDETRKTLAQIFGGAAIILTFAWTFIKDNETLKQSWLQLANQEFIESSKLLSEDKLAAQISGIHGLGHVALSNPEYHMSVRDTLVAYLSNASYIEKQEHNVRPPQIKADIQAVIEVIGRRNLQNDDPDRILSLDNQYLTGSNFYKCLGFQNTTFYQAKLYGTNFRYSKLDNSHFDGADFSDWSAYGSGWYEAIPNNPNWEKWEKYKYIANFENASLKNATFTGTGLTGAKFSNVDLTGVDFTRANLSRADFRNSKNIKLAIFEDESGKACADVSPFFDKGSEISLPRCNGSN